MAAFDRVQWISGYTAVADYRTKQYHFVDATADTVVTLAGSSVGELGQGIIMNKPNIGEPVEIAGFGGGALMKLEGTVARNGEILANANSKGVSPAVAGDIVIAIAKRSGVTGDIIPVQMVLYRKHA